MIARRCERWRVVVQGGRDPLTGKRLQLSGSARTEREAVALHLLPVLGAKRVHPIGRERCIFLALGSAMVGGRSDFDLASAVVPVA